jgi:hypothetical protein
MFVAIAICTLTTVVPAQGLSPRVRNAVFKAHVFETVLRYELSEFASGDSKPIFIAIEGASPSPALLKRMADLKLNLKPASQTRMQRGLVVERRTGRSTSVLSIGEIVLIDDGHLALFVSWTSGNLGAHTYR